MKVSGRRVASRNPIKALSARKDLRNEYVELRTGVAEREMKRLRAEKCKYIYLIAFLVSVSN